MKERSVTSSTSAIHKQQRSRQTLKTAWVYLAAAAFCILFDRVYALFGHGVQSAAMSRMFLYPLLGGALMFFLQWLFVPEPCRVRHYRLLFNLYNSGLAALTVGSLLQGILEIAGTTSPYLVAFPVFGWTTLYAGLLFFLLNLLRNGR
jgi:hypothetical protein